VALATAGVAEPPAGPGLAEAATVLVDSAAPDAPKPSADFFAAACRAVGAPAERCLFVDGDERSVRGARAAGLSAYRWSGAGDLPYLRAALGL
jgi:putative hydrolase of the HAD superfamily